MLLNSTNNQMITKDRLNTFITTSMSMTMMTSSIKPLRLTDHRSIGSMRSPGNKWHLHLPGQLRPLLSGDHLHPQRHLGGHLLHLLHGRLHQDHKPDHQPSLPDHLHLQGHRPGDLLQPGALQKALPMVVFRIPVRLKPGCPIFHFSQLGNNWVPRIIISPAQLGPVRKFPNVWYLMNLRWKTTDLGLVCHLHNKKFNRVLHLPNKGPDNPRPNHLLRPSPRDPDNPTLTLGRANKSLRHRLLQPSGTFPSFPEHLHLKGNHLSTNFLPKTTTQDL